MDVIAEVFLNYNTVSNIKKNLYKICSYNNHANHEPEIDNQLVAMTTVMYRSSLKENDDNHFIDYVPQKIGISAEFNYLYKIS